jgi:hypothetical protein
LLTNARGDILLREGVARMSSTRRAFLSTWPLLVAPIVLRGQPPASSSSAPKARSGALFPTQPPDLVRELVTVAHGNFTRVKEMVDRQPALAKAAWDWGFGDWETAIGAASHVGSRPVVEYLLARGAQPTIFSSAMLGNLEVVQAFVAASPGIEGTKGPHGLTLAHHARMGGDRAKSVRDFLATLPAADEQPVVQSVSDDDLARIAGTYIFGPGADERIEIAAVKGQVMFTRAGGIGRPLFHVGQCAFFPMGSNAVRIRFTQEDAGTVMTIHDPDVVMTATRTASIGA